MTNPTYFTVVADFKSVVVDLASDVDADPQLGPVTAKVTFTPVLNNGDVILATNASPRPTVFVPAPIVARIDTDGRLKLRVAPDGDRDDYANLAAFPATGNIAKVYFAIDTQTFYRWIPGSSQYVADYSYAQVRLLADTGLLELDSPLYYKVTFSDVIYNGGPGFINSFTFQAPTSDTELNLVEVLRQPGQPAVGITKIAPGAVRAEDGNLIFSFNGVDIPEPVPYADVNVTMSATDITDSTATGRALITAASAAAARTTISASRASSTSIDLRDWPAVEAANWKTVLAGSFTTGSSTATGTPFTAADIGKIVMIQTDNGSVSGTQTHWKSTITAVSGTTATFANASPVTSSSLRVTYGFDGSTAINSALAEIQAYTDGPCDVYLGGNYRLTQLVIPPNIVLRGVSWKDSVAQRGLASLSRTVLAQLPGAERDFVIFGAGSFGTAIVGAGILNFDLYGPEKNVTGVASATTGNGVALRTEGSPGARVVDWFRIEGVSALNFPQSGFRCFGAVPMYLNECKAQNNGRFGFEQEYATGSGPNNALHILNFSADWNNLGALGFKGMSASETVFITGVKSEGHVTGIEADASQRGGPGYQSNCIVFDNCDQTVALINGVSHIRIERAAIGPGPAITIKDSTGGGKKPRLTFNGVMVRIGGWETSGTTGDAVTLRDKISSVDITNTVTSGTYPGGPTFPTLLDNRGNKLLQFVGYAGTATAFLNVYNAPNFPTIAAADSSQANVNLSLQPKGTGTIYLDSTTPSITAGASSGVDRSLNLISRGTGTVQINSVNAVDISSSQTLTNKNLSSGTNTFPTLNQNTTGTAANVTGTVAVANGGTGATTLTGLIKGSGTSALAAATAGTDYADPATDVFADAVTTGESTIPRRLCSSTNVGSGSGNCRLTYFTARKTETITQVRTLSGSVAAATSTLCRIGIYSVDGSGNLTLIASTPNDTALWAATNTAYTKSLSASFTKTRGNRYAVGIIFVGTTAPQLHGIITGLASENLAAPTLNAFTGGNSDLPSSIAVGSLTGTTAQAYTVLLP